MKNKQRKNLSFFLLFLLFCNITPPACGYVQILQLVADKVPVLINNPVILLRVVNITAMAATTASVVLSSVFQAQRMVEMQELQQPPALSPKVLEFQEHHLMPYPKAPSYTFQSPHQQKGCTEQPFLDRIISSPDIVLPAPGTQVPNPSGYIVSETLTAISHDVTHSFLQQYRTFAPPYTEEPTVTYTSTRTAHGGTTTMHCGNGNSLSFSAQAIPVDKVMQIRHQIAQQKAFESHATLERIRVDQDYRFDLVERINTVCDCLQKTLSSDPIESTIARLQLSQISMEEPFHSVLRENLESIQRRIFNNNGELVSIGKNEKIKPFIDNIYHEFSTIMGPTRDLHIPKLENVETVGRLQSALNYMGDVYKGGALTDNILMNGANDPVRQCVESGLKGDIYAMKEIAAQYPQNRVLQKISTAFEYKFCDENGIYRACAQDPEYINLSYHEKQLLRKDIQLQKNTNEALLVRHYIKQTFQESWGISDTAPRAVHDAIYNIIGPDGASLQNVHALIDATVDASLHKPVVQEAFFLPNGALKDFANYPRVQNLELGESIFATEHTPDLRRLNHLLYIEHAFKNQPVSYQATQCIDYLTAYINTETPTLKQNYGALYRATYSTIAANHLQLASQLPNLAITYDNPKQNRVHHNIVNAAALCIDAPAHIDVLQSPNLFDNYVGVVQEAHALNQMGFSDSAHKLLQEKFYDQIWDHTAEPPAISDEGFALYTYSPCAVNELIQAALIPFPIYDIKTDEELLRLFQESEEDAAEIKPESITAEPPLPTPDPNEEDKDNPKQDTEKTAEQEFAEIEKKYKKYKEMFKDTPGAEGKDGPLGKIEKCLKDKKPGNLGTARGALYELETAEKLKNAGQKNISIGEKLAKKAKSGIKVIKKLDADIVTEDLIIECKNWTWSKVGQKTIDKLKGNLPELKTIAKQQGKKFIFHSKNKIPETIKKWLEKNHINFFEG